MRKNKAAAPKTITIAPAKDDTIDNSAASKISVVIESKDPGVAIDRVDLTLTVSSRCSFFLS